MIKLKQLLLEASIACGECLSYAWKMSMYNQSNKTANRKMKIVYGSVQNKWLAEGRRYKHAWVEDGNLVKDWQTMVLGMSKWAKKGWPQKEFNEVWNPKKVKRYTPQETLDNKKKYGTINGWDWKK